jgi:RNA polymerase sigma-70 factor (ECF subfamily)
VGRFAGLLAYVIERVSSQRQLSLPSSDRDDLVADVLVDLLKNDAAALRAFARKSSLPTYLTVIARRVAVRSMVLAANSNRKVGSLRDGTAPLMDGTQQHARIERHDEIESLLGRLIPEEARLVRLHHIEGKSYGEISALTGMPLGLIGPTLSRANEKMRGQA